LITSIRSRNILYQKSRTVRPQWNPHHPDQRVRTKPEETENTQKNQKEEMTNPPVTAKRTTTENTILDPDPGPEILKIEVLTRQKTLIYPSTKQAIRSTFQIWLANLTKTIFVPNLKNTADLSNSISWEILSPEIAEDSLSLLSSESKKPTTLKKTSTKFHLKAVLSKSRLLNVIAGINPLLGDISAITDPVIRDHHHLGIKGDMKEIWKEERGPDQEKEEEDQEIDIDRLRGLEAEIETDPEKETDQEIGIDRGIDPEIEGPDREVEIVQEDTNSNILRKTLIVLSREICKI